MKWIEPYTKKSLKGEQEREELEGSLLRFKWDRAWMNKYNDK